MDHADMKKQIGIWREQRAEKLMARLTSTSTPSKRPSPSVLGIKTVPGAAHPIEKQAPVKQKPHKKGPIEVRQTKSSSLRIHLANPLLDIHGLECSISQSLLVTKTENITSDKAVEKRYSFAIPRQKTAIIERNKIQAPKPSPYHRVKSNDAFRLPNLNCKKNTGTDKVAHTMSKLNTSGIKTNQTKSVNNKQTNETRHDKNGRNINVSSTEEGSICISNSRRETFSIGSIFSETMRKTELQHFEENYCNKLDFNDTDTTEPVSSHDFIVQTEYPNKMNIMVQNEENISVERKETSVQSDTNKRRETFNVDLNKNKAEAKYKKNSVSNSTNIISDISSNRQKIIQSNISSVNKLRKSLCSTNVKNSLSWQNLDMKRNSKYLSTVNKLTKTTAKSREHDSHDQKQTSTVTNTIFPSKPKEVAALRRSQTFSHINSKQSLPGNRRLSFIISRNQDISSKKMVSPIIEEGSIIDDTLPMSTPKPKQISKSTANLSSVKATPYLDTLKKNLEQWLKKRSKSVDGYRHLQCFLDCKKAASVRTPLSNKNEANCIKTEQTNVQTSIEAVYNDNVNDKENLVRSPNEKKCSDSDDAEVLQQTRDALTDLRGLILEGYDHDECERWMQALHSRNRNIPEIVEYWECLAALEETRGDIKMAVDSYQRAIMRGAEVESVNKQLNRLFDKMVLLNINPTPTKTQKHVRIDVDPKNIFSSTVIRFALQQKAVKKLADELEVDENQLHYFATPVRRSTRMHRYNNPNCVRSLSELEPEIKNSVNFKPNPAF